MYRTIHFTYKTGIVEVEADNDMYGSPIFCA